MENLKKHHEIQLLKIEKENKSFENNENMEKRMREAARKEIEKNVHGDQSIDMSGWEILKCSKWKVAGIKV